VHETEALSLAAAPEARFHLPHEAHAAERWDITPDVNRHVAGMPRRKRGAAAMGVAADQTGPATGVGSAATPARGCPELEVQLRASCHRRERDTQV
jgi:hypothetical protein